jgi:hypothetical protein
MWYDSPNEAPIPLSGEGIPCNIQWFLTATMAACSAWFNVILTSDRLFAVFMPIKYKVTNLARRLSFSKQITQGYKKPESEFIYFLQIY